MIEEFYLYTFESTHGAISTEKILKPTGCTILPVPRAISTSCGISVRVEPDKFEESRRIFFEQTDLSEGEYTVYHIHHNKDTKEYQFEKVAL